MNWGAGYDYPVGWIRPPALNFGTCGLIFENYLHTDESLVTLEGHKKAQM